MREERPEGLLVSDIADSRIASDLAIAALIHDDSGPGTVAELKKAVASPVGVGEHWANPEDFWELAERVDYSVQLSPSRSGLVGCFDVEFSRDSSAASLQIDRVSPVVGRSELKTLNWSSYTNDPLQNRMVASLVTKLREHLTQKLPAYMHPTAFVVLDQLPITANGKLDRAALPRPRYERAHLSSDYVAPRTSLEQMLVELWQRLLSVESIGVEDDFFELGGDSLRAMKLVNELREAFGEYIYAMAVFDAPTVAGLAKLLDNRLLELDGSRQRSFGDEEELPGERIDQAIVRRFQSELERTASPPRTRRIERTIDRPAVFVLGPPRSGTTLLRVLLGGHPRMFAPPELNLLSFETLGQRKQGYGDRMSFMLEGVIRAFMSARGIGPEEAKTLVQGYEEEDLSVADFYATLVASLEDRILVDKSALYAESVAILESAEQIFPSACYIHLVRHPAGTIHSFVQAQTDQLLSARHSLQPHQLGELYWLVCHQNIQHFLSKIPQQRQMMIRYEDLVRTPEVALTKICRMLDLEFDAAMLRLYEDPGSRMTDGIHDLSVGLIDPRFHSHTSIDASIADRWRGHVDLEGLGDPTRQLAASLGYQDCLAVPTDSEAPETVALRSRPVGGIGALSSVRKRAHERSLLDQLDEMSDDEIQRILAAQRGNREMEDE
ncbi:MAG: hypothetical protein HKN84_10220 [Gammaproteobacteria bacterium]|nr:hypothetical protein [Gammaproteobacteria bacterium]